MSFPRCLLDCWRSASPPRGTDSGALRGCGTTTLGSAVLGELRESPSFENPEKVEAGADTVLKARIRAETESSLLAKPPTEGTALSNSEDRASACTIKSLICLSCFRMRMVCTVCFI